MLTLWVYPFSIYFVSQLLSLKMDEEIFRETEGLLKKIHLPRNAYINRAVAFYNRCQKRLLTKKKIQKDVAFLKDDTRQFIESFELLEDLSE